MCDWSKVTQQPSIVEQGLEPGWNLDAPDPTLTITPCWI